MDSNSTRNSPAANGLEQLLVADIGGTNARFALADAVSGEVRATQNFATADFSDTSELIARVLAEFSITPCACAIAIAGPVAAGRGRLTNGTLEFAAPVLAQQLACPVRLMNDFYAVAASIHDQTPVAAIGPHLKPTVGIRAVIGPGTGLGMAYLVPRAINLTAAELTQPQHWRVVASEGGNADFAPVDALELELLGILQRQFGTVSLETLVSGRGLPNLYRALCELWGAAPEHQSAAAITNAALALTDPVSHKCLELFCAMLGTAAGNLALTVGAQGGVYLAGGILPRIREFFLASDFRRRFVERGPLASYNEQIATWLVLDPEPGLSGAVVEAQALMRAPVGSDFKSDP